MSEDLVNAANLTEKFFEDQDYSYIKLWDDSPDTQDVKKVPQIGQTRESVILLVKNSGHPDGSCRKPAAIVCAGGAYTGVALLHEGLDTARELEKNGYGVFVLYYRTAPNRYPEPQKDLALAVKYVRAHADLYGIDPDNAGRLAQRLKSQGADVKFMSFPSGGHGTSCEGWISSMIDWMK